MTFPTNHRLAIRAITNCVENHSYGSYKDAVQSMLPLYDAAPNLLEALEQCLTLDGAMAERNHTYALKRLQAINEIVKEAIAKARKTK